MVPFMSSVSCLFERIGGIESENGQHQKCLMDIVESWGFELIPVPGDGDCCFSALAFSILTQLHNIERRLPGFGTNYDIECNSSIADVGKRLRRIAVDEWMNHADEYQHFLDEGHKVTEEATHFLQQGHFFGPLANTMVVAISNALGLPIIIFSSACHYPVINITPRVCKVSIPIYVAFNQSGAGHYDAVSFKDDIPAHTVPPSISQSTTKETRCNCGKSDKHYSTTKRCVVLQYKYTTSIRCPCLLNGHSCDSSCSCRNCDNPKGSKPKKADRKRVRERHAWSLKPSKSIIYAYKEKEKVLSGPRTQLEYLLISQIFKSCGDRVELDTDMICKLYSCCVELAQIQELSIPLGPKTTDEISKILEEYEKNRQVFEATCITQLKINDK